MSKVKLIAVLIVVFLSLSYSSAYAVPQLQLYIPGATYVSGENGWATDSWYTPLSSFEIWVIGAKRNAQSANSFNNVTLVMAVPDGEYGDIHLERILESLPDPSYDYANPDVTFPYDDFSYGNPFGSQYHGVYNTLYATHNMGAMTLGDVTVQNMVDPYDDGDTIQNKPGNIFKFNFTKTGFSKVHFDAYADGEIFAPFSHDAEDGPIPPPTVPEPATMSLLGLGLFGLLRFKRKK